MTRRALPLLGALFLVHALPFLTRPALIGGDEPHYALMAHSLAIDRDVDLERDYLEVERGSAAAGRKFAGRRLDRHLVARDGDLYFSHPLGLPALAAPLVALVQAASPGAPPDLVLGSLGLLAGFLTLLAGYGLLRSLDLSPAEARLLAFALYFTTPLWFYSRVFFTEAYTVAFLVGSLWLLSRGRWIAASAALGAIFLLKEVNVLLILPVLAAVWQRFGQRRAARLALGPLLAFALWVGKNLWLYGAAVVTFQPFQLGDPLTGIVGSMVDPRHGLLPFAPVLLLALLAAGRRRGTEDPRAADEVWSLAAFLALFALTASWTSWGGGSSYGPRLLVPAIPALALSLVVAWRRVADDRAWRGALVVLLTLGFSIQWLAATDPFHALWEPSVFGLFAERPAMAAAGLALGYVASRRLVNTAFSAARGPRTETRSPPSEVG